MRTLQPTTWLLIGLGLIALLGGGAAVITIASWKRAGDAALYLPALAAAESDWGIPQDLLARMAYEESHFRPDIISGATASPAGAQGIMQIVPAYHPDVNPLDPFAAITYAAQYLAQLYNQFGSWQLAVAAYNAGPGNVQKYNGIPPFTETQNYVRDIFADVQVA